MRPAGWIAAGLAAVSAAALAVAIHVKYPRQPELIHWVPVVPPWTDAEEADMSESLREGLRFQRTQFERATPAFRVSRGRDLLRVSLATILRAQGRQERHMAVPGIYDVPEIPPDESDPRAGSYSMTMVTRYFMYTFRRDEFPEFAETNDMFWRYMRGGGSIPEPPSLPEPLAARILARADEAIANLDQQAAAK